MCYIDIPRMKSTSEMTAGERFERLVGIMARLRAPDGCPWDRQQDFDTIKPYLVEEAYEVMDAIDARDWPGLAEELGDLLLQSVFLAQMAAEQRLFTINDSLDAINNKLVRRHPHVFAGGDADTPEKVKQRWDEIKAEEKRSRGDSGELLAGVSRSQPALAEAAQISSKVAAVGFDWETTDQVLEKLQEELDELAEARSAARTREHIEEELGDVLFVIVNLARHLRVDPEQALRKANAKFRRRFRHVERRLIESGRGLRQAGLDEMDALWEEAKQQP